MNCKKDYMAFDHRDTSKLGKKDMDRCSQEENIFRMAVATWTNIPKWVTLDFVFHWTHKGNYELDRLFPSLLCPAAELDDE